MIIRLAETDSTNNYLRNLLSEDNSKTAYVVQTDYQTQGRGQKGNSWQSEREKNLLFSIVVYPDFLRIKEQFLISQTVSLAIKKVLDKYADNITIKWPNDIYWNDSKICGILIENDLSENFISRSIIGIGININQDRFNYETAPNAISLKQITNTEQNRESILLQIINNIHNLYLYAKENKHKISEEYKNSLYRKEGYYAYQSDGVIFSARIADVEPEGFLVLEKEDKTRQKYVFKEVKFL